MAPCHAHAWRSALITVDRDPTTGTSSARGSKSLAELSRVVVSLLPTTSEHEFMKTQITVWNVDRKDDP